MARITLTKAELESQAGQEFVKFVEGIGLDGKIEITEISALLSAVENGGKFSTLVGAGFLRDTILEIISDGKIEQYEIERLRYSISRMLPKRIRDGSDFYSKEVTQTARSAVPAWHLDPATDKQFDLMMKLGIAFHPGITKGEASELISRYIEEKDSKPTPRQMMVIRFFNKMELANCTKSEVSDWMDRWYSEDPKRRDAWEMYKSDNGGDVGDPNDVGIGVGLAYVGQNRPAIDSSLELQRIEIQKMELPPHLRPRTPKESPSIWARMINKIRGRGAE